MCRPRRLVSLVALGLLTASSPLAREASAQHAIPRECPRVLITWTPGLGPPTIRGGVIAAIWDSGMVLRAESFANSSGPHVLGEVPSAEAHALVASVRDSPYWRRPFGIAVDAPVYHVELLRGRDRLSLPVDEVTEDLDAIQRRIYALGLTQTRRLVERIDERRWSCPARSSP